MLTEEEKAHILLEERYRADVRRAMDSEQPTRSAFVRFANSSFGLWLLSAVFISGLGAGITWYKGYLDERARVSDKIERLDVEIAYRLSQEIGLLDSEFQQRETGEVVGEPAASSEGQLTASLTNQSKSSLLSLYPDFGNLSVSGLMAELRRHIEPARRPEVDRALLTLTNGTLTRDAAQNPKVVAGRLFSDVLSARKEWTEAKFSYTDCSAVMPFC